METYDVQSTLIIEEKWVNIKRRILNNKEKIFEKSKEIKRKEWINEEILGIINERKRYKNAIDQRRILKYRKLKNAINRKCKKQESMLE